MLPEIPEDGSLFEFNANLPSRSTLIPAGCFNLNLAKALLTYTYSHLYLCPLITIQHFAFSFNKSAQFFEVKTLQIIYNRKLVETYINTKQLRKSIVRALRKTNPLTIELSSTEYMCIYESKVIYISNIMDNRYTTQLNSW